MAFVFNKIEDQLNGGGQQNQNIFGDAGQPMGQQQGQQGQQGAGGAAIQKSSNEGDIGPAPTTGGEGAAKAPPKESDAKILKMNQPSDVGAQPIVQKAFSSADQTKQKIQDEANKLAQSSAPQIQQFSKEQLQGAAQGSSDEAAVKGLLSQGPIDIARPTINVSTELQNLRALQDSNQRQALLMKQGGPGMTHGMAALDEMLLKRSPEFRNVMSQLNQQQQSVIQDKAAAEARAEQQAEATANANLQAEQARVKTELGGLASGIQGSVANQLKTLQDQRGQQQAAALSSANANLTTSVKDQLDKLANYETDINMLNPNSPEAIQAKADIATKRAELQGVSADKYLTGVGTGAVSQAQATSPEQAAQFNRIMELLGQSDRLSYDTKPLEQISYQSNAPTYDLSNISNVIAGLRAAQPAPGANQYTEAQRVPEVAAQAQQESQSVQSPQGVGKKVIAELQKVQPKKLFKVGY